MMSSIDNYLDKLERIALTVKEAIEEASAKGWEATLSVYTLKGASKLVSSFFWAIIAPVIVYYLYFHFYELSLERYGSVNQKLWDGIKIALSLSFAIVIPPHVTRLVDVWNWVALFKPEIALAKVVHDRIVDK